MMADDAPTNATEAPENAADESTAGNASAAGAEPQQAPAPNAKAEAGPKADAKPEAGPKADAKPEAKPAKAKPAPEPEEEPEPVPDPETCKAIALGLPAFWESAFAGEWDDTDFEYYLEPAGVLNGPLACSRAPEDDPQRAGLLMTRAAWKAKTLFLDDGINPDTYELSFPKEFGYVKPLAHYKEETRELAHFPWSKKY